MDLTMADYDGLYAIKRIMSEFPTPIVVLSALGTSRPEVVFEALEAGAYDFLHKPQSVVNSQIRTIEQDLVDKLVEAAGIAKVKLSPGTTTVNTFPHTFQEDLNYDVLVIGASTGGPRTLEQLVQMLPRNFAIPIVIAQHMPEKFISGFARRMDELINLEVKVAEDGEALRPGVIYFASGKDNLRLERRLERVKLKYTKDQFPEFNNPSVDCLFKSAANVYGEKAVGLILTGMGRDGARGLSDIYESGGLTIAQDEDSSVIFGMPKAAITNNCVNEILPLKDIAGYIVNSL
jgi:two-component system chemotaxis response regulator CheB